MYGLGYQELLLPLIIPILFGVGLLIYLLTHPEFFRALLDWSFTEFVTTRIIRFLYGCGLVIATLLAIAAVFRTFGESFSAGLAVLISALFLLLIYAVLSRMWFELMIVIFRIAEHTAVLAGRKGQAGALVEPQSSKAPEFCTACGARRTGEGRFCLQCGQAFL